MEQWNYFPCEKSLLYVQYENQTANRSTNNSRTTINKPKDASLTQKPMQG